jgi:squalene-associated FAD-dependent desaturase
MIYDVAVVGGGLSGLAAAVRLTINGARVILIEQANKLGGRAYSYTDKKTSDIVDNGQHVLAGAYRCTLQYLKTIGTRDLLTLPEDFHLHFHHPEKGFATFTFDSVPFGITYAALRLQMLSFVERLRLLNAGLQLRTWNEDLEATLRQLTVAEWLQSIRQSEDVNRSFWYPIAVSVMNESPEKASALLFARSLHNTFFADISNAKILIPRVGQSELYVNGATSLFASRGTKVLLNTETQSLSIYRGKANGVILKDEKRVRANTVIIAVPYFALRKLCTEKLLEEITVKVKKFASSPIVSVHLWFDRPIMDRDFVGLIGRRVQWVFNRRRIMREHDKPENYLSAIMSGAHEYVDLPKEKLIRIAAADIATAYPSTHRAKLIHSIVIKEKRATFSPTNEVEPLRPSSQTSVENLYLAGDWTNTGLPPTIEGAIMSGFRCAELAQTS